MVDGVGSQPLKTQRIQNLDSDFKAVKRVKFAKVKRNTSKLRLLLSLSKV